MADNLSWRSFDVLAQDLQKAYPETELLFLKNSALLEMISRLEIFAKLPAMPDNAEEIGDICYGIKIAWTRLAGKTTNLTAPVTED